MQPARCQLRTSLDSLEGRRHQLAEGWERDRREWRENVRAIVENWRSELGAELERTRAEMAHELAHSTARRPAADLYMALPCVPSLFPGKGAHIIVDTLKTRAEALGPLKAAAMQRDGDVCSICLEPMQAGEQAIALPCHHIFHWACLCPWIERKGAGAECPFCKRGICPELSKENKWAVAAVQQHQRQREQERLDLLRSRQLESQDTLGTTMMVSDGSAAASRSAAENSLVSTAAPTKPTAEQHMIPTTAQTEEAGLHPLGSSIGNALESATGVETVERAQSQLTAGCRPSFIERRRHQQMRRWSETTQRQPTRVIRNSARLAQEFLPPPTHPHTNPSAQSQATPLDLRVSGSLDIDYHWTLEEGRRMTAAAQIVQLTNEMRDDIPR